MKLADEEESSEEHVTYEGKERQFKACTAKFVGYCTNCTLQVIVGRYLTANNHEGVGSQASINRYKYTLSLSVC